MITDVFMQLQSNMADDLLNAFNNRLSVTKEQNNSSSVHPRYHEYKGRSYKPGDQANRRKEVLDIQKKRRFDAVNYARKLAEGDLDEDEFEEASMDIIEEDDCKPNKKRFNPYKNQLMLSEWVVDPPSDLLDNWRMVVCPVGKRLLVVAHKGQTCAYTKNGYMYNSFPSLLPGGCYKTWQRGAGVFSNFTIVDCIYDEINCTFWMIDLMCYKGNPIYDSDAEFRFFWLHSKLIEDSPGLQEKSKINPFKFIPCENVPCDNDAIINALTDMYPFEVDGVLFYHKLSHYHPGRTPLVGWLKPYMIPDILGIPLPNSVMESLPVEFNREILLDANKKLQKTVSDRSFISPVKSPGKGSGSNKGKVNGEKGSSEMEV